jgi:uncharacterized protein
MHAVLSKAAARRLWIAAQRLDVAEPFGHGPEATRRAIEHLGYVQIDTINVIERCHHHILFSRIPGYVRDDLVHAQSTAKSVFEYWTHALSYVPVRDLRYYVSTMKRYRREPHRWYGPITPRDRRKVLALLRDSGPLTIRDIDDDVLVEKDHAWSSRKPSKKALQQAFFDGTVTISARAGMLKTYDLTERHFGWERLPKPASESEITAHLLDRALTAQGLVSLDSICHLDAKRKPAMRQLIERRVRRKELAAVQIAGAERVEHWIAPDRLETAPADPTLTHILSPFDPLIIQRKRLALLFDYTHLFEAYVPKERRVHGYFALPVLIGDTVVAVLDLKTDRQAKKVLIQNWTWVGAGSARAHKRLVEAELHRFERFQLG